MSKSRNSKNYQEVHGEDLLYENYIFGERTNKNPKSEQYIKNIENRRLQRHMKYQQLMEL